MVMTYRHYNLWGEVLWSATESERQIIINLFSEAKISQFDMAISTDE